VARKRLGEILIEEGLIDERDLNQALKYKEQSGYRLGTSLVALRIIAEWQLTEALGKALNLAVVDLVEIIPSASALSKIPSRLAERFDLIPLKITGRGKNKELMIAMSDPLNRSVIKRMQDVAECPIKPVLAGLSAIQRAIREHYHPTAKSKTLKRAERIRTARISKQQSGQAVSAKVRRKTTMKRLIKELDSIGKDTQLGLALLPAQENLGEYLLNLEIKLRALLHLMLKKKVISQKEYVQTLKHFLEAIWPDK